MRNNLILFFSLLGILSFSQTKISGTVKNSADEKAIYNATVILEETGQRVLTDRIGYFQFTDVPEGIYTINIEMESYISVKEKIRLNGEKNHKMGDIFITYAPESSSLGVITLSADDLTSDENSISSSVSLLNSSQDAFLKTSAYEWGSFWFRPRGLNNENSQVLFNGFKMNKAHNGRVDYNNWGGLNDITRYPEESTFGINSTEHSFGDLGGLTYFDTRPSKRKTGSSLAYSLTNRSYRQRLIFTHNTGLMKNGWGFIASGSRRWANEGQIPGTFYDAWSYYIGIEKKLNSHHSIMFNTFGAPTKRAGNSPNTQEIFNLAGKNYNAYWGYQDERKRNERVKQVFEPVFQLSHNWNINLNNQLETSISYQTGSNKSSRLNTYNISNPSPLYYRNLPSYFYYYHTKNNNGILSPSDNEKYLSYIDSWKSDDSWRQINWNKLYYANLNQPDGHAIYYLANNTNDDDKLGFYSHLRSQLKDNVVLNAGVMTHSTKSHVYNEVKDLLGAKYAFNIDGYKDEGTSGNYNEGETDNKIKQGGIIEYNFNSSHNQYEAFANLGYKEDKLDLNFSGELGLTQMYREGLFNHYAYTNSKGKSETLNFTDLGVKINAVYKINGKNFILLNSAYQTKAPSFNSVFPLARYSNVSLPNVKSAKIHSTDISYILRSPRFSAKATGFYTFVRNETQTNFGYIELSTDRSLNRNIFTSEVLNNVNKEYLGAEIAAEASLTKTITAKAAASIGQYLYKNNPHLYYFSDDFAKEKGGYKYVGKAYLKNYKLSGTPQHAYNLSLEYRSPKYWWAGISGNYLANQYVGIASSSRTKDFTRLPNGQLYPDLKGPNGESKLRKLLKQEKFSDEFMLNLSAGKTFRLGQYYIGAILSVNNILNNKNYKTSGFEQLRVANYEAASNENYAKVFGNRYWYNQGTNYFLNIFFRF